MDEKSKFDRYAREKMLEQNLQEYYRHRSLFFFMCAGVVGLIGCLLTLKFFGYI